MKKVRVRKRGKTYSFAFEAGKKADGRRKVVERGGFATQEAAYEAGVKAFTDWSHGSIGVTSERMTVEEFSILYLKYIAAEVRPTSYTAYTGRIRSRILPAIGGTVLQDLKPAQIDSWLRSMYGEGLSKAYIHGIHALLKKMLDYAVYPCELLDVNPCLYAKVPRNAPTNVIKRTVITREVFDELLQSYPSGHYMHLPILIMYHTGLRISEALGLFWEDIDFAAGTLTVNRQILPRSYGRSKRQLTAPKTEKSIRSLYMPPELIKALHEEQGRQLCCPLINVMDGDGWYYCYSDQLDIRSGMTVIHPVCLTNEGRIPARNSIITCLNRHGLNSHSFRHTQATRLAEAGVQPVTAAARLGHSKPDTTLTIYTHDTAEQQKKAVRALVDKEAMDFFDS